MKDEEFIEDKVDETTAITQGTTEIIEDKQAETTETTETTAEVSDEVLGWFKGNGIEVATREELTPFIEKVKNYDTESEKVKTHEAKIAELSAREADMTEKFTYLKDLADPLKMFGSVEEYKTALLKKQRPDLDPIALGQVMTKDLAGSDPRDILKLQMKLNFPDLSSDEVEAYLAEKYGTEDFSTTTELKELETLSQTKIKIDSKEALKEFNTLKDGVKVPEAIDVDAYLSNKKKETKESLEKASTLWEPLVKTIPDALDKVTFAEGGKTIFEYNIEESYRKSISDGIGGVKDYLVSQNIEPTAENCKIAINQLKENYMNAPENRLKIMNAYATKKANERELELKKEFNNPTLGNDRQSNRAPVKTTQQEDEDALLAKLQGRY
jgi:hypothetical protein